MWNGPTAKNLYNQNLHYVCTYIPKYINMQSYLAQMRITM